MLEKSYLFRQAQNAKGNFRRGLLQGSKRSSPWEESTRQTQRREDKEERSRACMEVDSQGMESGNHASFPETDKDWAG